jgi:uncharacterized protein (UPF0335 family)
MMEDNLTETAADRLRLLVERIERLESEKREIADQITAVYAEAKALGYDVKVLRQIVKERSKDKHELDEHEAILDVYRDALNGYLPPAKPKMPGL